MIFTALNGNHTARLFILFLIAINLIFISQALAAEMFIGGASTTKLNDEETSSSFTLTGDYKFFLNKITMSENCISLKNVILYWNSPVTFKNQYIRKFGPENSHWNSPQMPNERVQYRIKLTGEIVNNCKSPQYLSLDVSMIFKGHENDRKSIFAKTVTLPSPEICSAKLTPDIIAFGSVSPERSYSQRINYKGNGNVEITSRSMKNGRLRLNDSDDVYVNASSEFVSANNSWQTDPRRGDIPLTLYVGKSAKAGKYQANLTATLTCP
ncbi:hypothetical protein [Serratia sp. M24T3]|uniref:hypothetical protein n=1 Tax=Serratia sp. M24T3 TaxID=932213 RepID=UPI00025BAF36|nr:hypothetical protein [Serratia sp. M24T3]EIC85706.1 hypothetical protein SPM24T3_05186 [Serratia sp. M24T3]